MSIEQMIRITVAGIILYVMLIALGELETLKWMLMVVGLAILALGISAWIKKKEKE